MKTPLFINLYVLLIVLALSSAVAKAQIVYTDLVPDISDTCVFNYGGTCNHNNYFDINNDGNIDFGIFVYNYYHSNAWCNTNYYSYSEIGISASAFDSNEIAIVSGSIAMQFYLSDTIGILQSWVKPGVLLANTIYFYFPCPSPGGVFYGDGYLGLKLVKSGQNYYGWMRINSNPNTPTYYSCTIYEYAFNSVPNQFILAGDTGAGPTGIMDNMALSSINLFPNPADELLVISYPLPGNENTSITITDITGKIIYSTIINTQKTVINTGDFAAGLYLVQMRSTDFVQTKRITIVK